MIDRKRKEFISEEDMATLLQRYDTMTILKLLQEMAYYAEPKMDWNEMLKKTSTGITNARDYQLLWRHLAYRDSLLPVDDNALPLDDDSDMECELETSPAVNVDVVSEAVAHVKVIASSFVPSDLDIPEDSTFEAPLTINIPYGHRGPQEPSDSYWSSKGMNITFPISLQKAAEGHNGNGLASSVAARKKRKKWSAEEDEELIAAVKRHGEGSWVTISKEEFEGERTVSQLSQRWGFLRKRGDTSNSSTQSGLHRTEEQMAANRALSLAVGNRVPSKKAAVGIPPVRTSGTITGAQANGANNGNSLQGQQQSQPVVQATPRVATSIPTTKSRVPAKKTTANSTSRSALMVTASFPRPSAISSALNAEPVKNASPSATSFPRPSGISSALNAERVKAASAASFPRPSGISSAPNVVPVKTASAAILPRPLGVISASKAEPFKTAPVAFLPRPSGTISAPNAEAVKAASAVSLPGPSSIISASKAEPVKSVAAAGPSNVRNAVTGSPRHVLSSSPMAPFSKGPTIQNNPSPGFASSRLAPTQRVPAANVIPQKPNAGAGVTATCKPVGVQTQGNRANPMVTPTLQSNKAISTNSVITTAKPVAAKVETPSLLPKHTQVPQTEVGSGTEKS
ncbi:PREDICTED: cell wall protein AWA1 isoform X2 [Brassica oleracea var. oleracea]|uniref:cell wall protein AWA1 isoform X2 n=1 Tax=Brassica oleracea var. oleracea TaxID=109376 RepID=UPI0006A74469|nr:PREDICTED: cell wall protein AWA1 isoform X2 [Brassica oleracea var. oleracea]